jgi:hypothetical protein
MMKIKMYFFLLTKIIEEYDLFIIFSIMNLWYKVKNWAKLSFNL